MKEETDEIKQEMKREFEENEEGIPEVSQKRQKLSTGMRRRITTTEPSSQVGVDAIRKQLPSNANEKVMDGERGLIRNAIMRFGLKDSATTDDREFHIPNIKTPLTPIQMGTAGWMISRERSTAKRLGNGGIVAHDMGIGKTLIAIACIVGNHNNANNTIFGETKESKGRKRDMRHTLIICPNEATVRHWKCEMLKHCPSFFGGKNVYRYRSSHVDGTVDVLKQYKAVFATYNDLRNAMPKADSSGSSSSTTAPASNSNTPGSGSSSSKPEHWNTLFLADWYRIILDESHAIKNISTKSSQAALELKTRHGWAITGTLIPNSPNELYPHFKFLGVEGCETRRTFQDTYFLPPAEHGGPMIANSVLNAAITKIVMQKSKLDTFMGKPIIELPKMHQQTVELSFLPHEKVIYETIRVRTKKTVKECCMENGKINEKKGDEMRKLVFLGVMCQILGACHPFLLEQRFYIGFASNELRKLREVLDEHGQVPTTTLSPHVPPSMSRLLELLDNTRTLESTECCNITAPGECVSITPDQSRLECSHSVCAECMKRYRPTGLIPCATCREQISAQSVTDQVTLESARDGPHLNWFADYNVRGRGETPHPGISAQGVAPSLGTGVGKTTPTVSSHADSPTRPGDDIEKWQPKRNHDHGFFKYTDNHISSHGILPSTKLVALLDILQKWRSEAPDDKIIVFTQYIKMGHCIARVAQNEGVKFLYYFGDQTENRKSSALKQFRENREVKLLISSLKCGGQALDMTCANRVVIMEPWWNSPVEAQAAARVHRMGQRKECYVVRFVVKDSIESEMLKVQDMKEDCIKDTLLQNRILPGLTMYNCLKFIGIPVCGANGRVDLRLSDDEDNIFASFGVWNDEAEDTDDLKVHENLEGLEGVDGGAFGTEYLSSDMPPIANN